MPTFVANIRHYLNKDGTLPVNLPRPALNIANFLGKIIEAVTSPMADTENYFTNVRCRRRPSHKPCIGRIVAFIEQENGYSIRWFCPFCNDNGYISGWQGTAWDRSEKQ